MIPRRNLQWNLSKGTRIIQEIKKGVPLASVHFRIGDITHQYDSLNALQMVPQVFQGLLGMLKLADIPNDPKRHRVHGLVRIRRSLE